MTDDRNRTTVRRALRAGATAGVFFVLVALVLAATGRMPVAAVVAGGIAVAAFVAAGWLLLSYLLDLIAGETPDRRRTVWTVATVIVAMLGPFLVLGAFVSGAGGAQ